MLYEEFVRGTGCRENEHNYEVYKNLEIMYMNSDLSKEQIYEYGKKLVDNSLSKEQLEWNEEVNARIAELKAEMASYKEYVVEYVESARMWAEEGDKEMVRMDRNAASFYRDQIKQIRVLIQQAKDMLYI